MEEPDAIAMDAEELAALRWVRFRADGPEPLPPVYAAFEDAGVALVYDETPALRTYREQLFDPPPRVRPSIWRKIAREGEIVHIAAVPFVDHVHLGEDSGISRTEVVAAHLHSIVLRREIVRVCDYLNIPVSTHYVTYGEVTALARKRGLEPALDHLPALLPELPELPGDYWIDRTEAKAGWKLQKTHHPDSAIIFPVTVAAFHQTLDAFALLLTDEDGYIQKTYVSYPTRVIRDQSEYSGIVRSLLARVPEQKRMVAADVHVLGISEEGMYVFQPILGAAAGGIR